ncbi:MAG: DUF3048 domain-containing protein [Chloroflexi bacterium]|nr:DUF3048 domain-containing protein [Chloroflexota bacterium]
MSRRIVVAVAIVAVIAIPLGAVALGAAVQIGGSGPAALGAPPSAATASPAPSAAPTPAPTPTPIPTPVLVPGPLDGLPITTQQALAHPIAVMIDDLYPARPQSGFTDASVVWQAPAEGGIPRYMLVFQEGLPKDVGPIRSARYYFIAWAAEWDALYVHAGGSPQALETLAAQGGGQLVYNADQFFNGTYFRRTTDRFPPHNLYTTGLQLRELATKLGATAAPPAAAWQFGTDAPLAARPSGGSIEVDYPANTIVYRYDQATNTYARYVSGGVRQIDAGTRLPVSPRNVIVMRMVFGPLNDGEPAKHRLEATVVGSGTAWIATNGVTIKGTWRKPSLAAPTRFYDAAGSEVVLTAGQTFIQVMEPTDPVKIVAGIAAGQSASPGSGSPSASFQTSSVP